MLVPALATLLSRKNNPTFVGGESRAIIGPSDPLWAYGEAAERASASGADPFLDRAEVDRVSGSIRAKRKCAFASGNVGQRRSIWLGLV